LSTLQRLFLRGTAPDCTVLHVGNADAGVGKLTRNLARLTIP
jgi:hypothetical protein